MRKERERGQNHKKGRNDCHILEMIAFMCSMRKKNTFPPDTFPIQPGKSITR